MPLYEVGEPRKAPTPFEPAWRATIGPLKAEGKGILSKPIFAQRDLIEQFELIFQSLVVRFNLRNGEVWFCPNGASPVLQYKPDFPPDTKFRLIWVRRMSMTIHTEDKNTEPPQCLFYIVGWQTTVAGTNYKYGLTIKQDGDGNEAEIFEGFPERRGD